MLTVLVINSKGGSGKTTLSTNLASYYASKQRRVALMDYDPQGSSMQWLKIRPASANKIHGANAAPPKGAVIQRSLQAWVPTDIEVVVIDAPAGVKGLLLQELVRKANFIIIPVSPSPIDIHASADFIKDLYLSGGVRSSSAKIAVVANRVRNASTSLYASLENFLSALKLPILTSIGDSDHYLQAAAKGLGVFEMDELVTAKDRRDLLPIMKWLDGHLPNKYGVRAENKIISLEDSRKWQAYRTGEATSLSSSGKFNRHN
jgi:chromosome partitioning protein